MKWLIDAQLPRRLARRLNELGQEAIHTLELPAQNRTTDSEISAVAARDGRIVVSKDSDFLDSYLVTNQPPHLLWVTTGNISNDELLKLFESLLPDLEQAFQQSNCIELTPVGVTIHG